MRYLATTAFVGSTLLSGCAYEFEASYEEINTGKGFDKACIAKTIQTMADVKDVKLLTNGVELVHQSFPTLVLYERDVPVSGRLQVLSASTSARKQLDFVTSDFADKIAKYCSVSAAKAGGVGTSKTRSGSSSVVNWPWYRPWDVSEG